MLRRIVILLIVLGFIASTSVKEGNAYVGEKCTKLAWCLDTACPHERDTAEAACWAVYAARMTACALMLPVLRKACRKLAKRDLKCCLGDASVLSDN